jgi:hypothetical protein
MQDRIGIVADWLTQGYLETCEIHDALINMGMTQEDAYLTYVAGKMVFEDRKTAFEAKQAGTTKPTIKMGAVKAVSLTIDTPVEIVLCDRNDPPPLA